MAKQETIHRLNGYLLDEMPEYRPQAAQFPRDGAGQRRLLRSLMNLRPPMPLHQDFLAVQDELLTAETAEKGVVDALSLPAVASHPRLMLWQGDITHLKVDAIVNAASSGTNAMRSCAGRDIPNPTGAPS